MLSVHSASLTDTGRKRSHNEDFIALFEPSDPHELMVSGCLYIVADGVGGSVKGERASRYAAEKVLYEFFRRQDQPPADRLRELLWEAGNDIYAYASENEHHRRMATTLVAAVIWEATLTVANVGDSRAYLIRSDAAMQITKDHTELGEASSLQQVGNDPVQRGRGRNKITRSLGGEANILVDIYSGISLKPGDRILLCSDGLTRYAQAEDLVKFAGVVELEQAVSSLVGFANQRGGADNISVIIIEVSH
jgi:protein phosphatase